MPAHIGLILDGNRRWARRLGLHPAEGHRAGFGRIAEVLGWCEDEGVKVVTLWMLSVDNLTRPADELEPLLEIIAGTAAGLAATGRWRLHQLGEREQLPPQLEEALDKAVASSASATGMDVNLAICYGGREEIVQAAREVLRATTEDGPEAWRAVQVQDLSRALPSGPIEPDLIIRTSGEQRSSGFLLWSGVGAELWFCPSYWPAFSRRDLNRAIQHYQKRRRPRGNRRGEGELLVGRNLAR